MAKTFVKRSYLCSPTDLPRIEKQLSQPGASVCMSHEAYEAEGRLNLKPEALAKIRQSDEVVYILSKDSDCSTAYQALVLASLPESRTKLCSRLIFDKTVIALGLKELRVMPDVDSAYYQLRLFLHRAFRKVAV